MMNPCFYLSFPLLSFLISQILFIVAVSNTLKGNHGVLDQIEFVYQIPSLAKTNLKGVVFFAHGCSHHARDWWPKSESCQNCLGLPVELSLTKTAIDRGYAAIAISSENQVHHCWTEDDLPRVKKIIKHFYMNVLIDSSLKLPFYALGASSGGSFVGLLAQYPELEPPLASICVQISVIRMIGSFFTTHVLFVPMVKDSFIFHRVERNVQKLQHAKVLKADEKPITKDYFYKHSSGFFTIEESELLHDILKKNQFIDQSSELLIVDPRESNWRDYIRKQAPEILKKDSLIADASPTSELLNLAFALHEITDEFNQETFDFFSNSIHQSA